MVHTISKEMEKKLIRKTVNIVETKASEDGSRSLIVKISTINPDRSKDIVRPSGAVLDNYLKNPVVAAFHNYYQPAIGIASDITISEDGITAKVTFPKPGVYELADTLYELYKEGIQRGWSIGFIPMEWTEKAEGGYDFTKWELLEFSAVVVPDNPEALTIMRSKGLNADTFEQAIAVKDKEHAPACPDLKTLFPDLYKKEETVAVLLKNVEIVSEKSLIVTHFTDGSKIEYTGDADLMKFFKELFEAHAQFKEGRVLSSKNRDLISNAIKQMNEAGKALQDLIEASESEKSKEKEEVKDMKGDDLEKFLTSIRSNLKKIDKDAGLSLQAINKLFNFKNSEQR